MTFITVDDCCCSLCGEHSQEQLNCGHNIHKECIQEQLDDVQYNRFAKSKPPLHYGECPVCHDVQYDIIARWLLPIKLYKEEMIELAAICLKNNGWVSLENIPKVLDEQMSDASIEEKLDIANTIASVVVLRENDIPDTLDIVKHKHGAYKMFINAVVG